MGRKFGINDMPRGWRLENQWNKRVYEKWDSMLQRCYYEKVHEKQPTYKGCFVCKEWFILSNFVKDIIKIDGYDEKLFIEGKLVLDKDIKSDNKNKCYCIEQCIFVTQAENVKQSNKHRDNTKFQGENHYLFGNHRSEETKKKISERNKGKNNPRSKRIAQYDFDGNLIRIWDYMKQAETELGINSNNICSCCRGKLKSAGGFIWKYVD